MPRSRQDAGRKLADYRRKRSAEKTPEPWGGGADRPGLFVVHKHAARRLHYDLRLEMSGVLQSWAVPKGPSLAPEDKRLAVKVEEHPLEYADFEGVIPKDNYGAGAMIVWDRGRWLPIGDPEDGLVKGKLLFDLHGYKLKGRWTLFRTGKSGKDGKEWLLVKKPDAYASSDGEELPQQSILSNLTVEEMGGTGHPAQKILRRVARAGAKHGDVNPERLGLMLAQTSDGPFTKKGWLFELKYDGYRLVAAAREGVPLLRYRRGQIVTDRFPEIAGALGRLPFASIVLDGELVVLDGEGRPRFQLLQQRVGIKGRRDVERAAVALPATLFAFDLLGLEGYDLRPLPLATRKEILREILPLSGPVRYADHIAQRGEEMFRQVGAMGLEGIMGKKADAPYREGRHAEWLKIRADRTGDFAIVGYSAPKRARAGFGALHIAAAEGDALVYAGRVGTGFTARQASDLKTALDGSRRATPPCGGTIPKEEGDVWVTPQLVCEVRYKEWTADGSLRHPVFLRLREDKTIEDCSPRDMSLRQAPDPPLPAIEPVSGPPAAPEVTNRDKVFWPEEGYTKGDLIDYYRAVAAWLLPYLQDRPVVLTRYPDGIEGKSFFQKDAPSFVPSWIRTETMWSEHAEREIHYFICEDERSLVYLANLGTIPLHIWSSRCRTLQRPDWCILDLDPKTAPFKDVIAIALALKKLCDDIGLPCFVKTSGSTGLHVLVPLGRQCTYEWSRTLGQLLAGIVCDEMPEIATTARTLAARQGRVYVDFLQNGHGKLLVAPYSVRPLPAAPVSMPLAWSAVKRGLDMRRYTIRTAPKLLARGGPDPFLDVLTTVPDLKSALRRLEKRQVSGTKRRRA